LLICSRQATTLECMSEMIRSERSPMAVAALKLKSKLRTFHATVHVTRAEEWCVEAETAEEARELLAAGAGYRCQIGDCLNLEIEHVED
jgi:hypothetical protein